MGRKDSLDLRVGETTCRIGRIGLEVHFAACGRIRAMRDAGFERTIAACARLDGEALHAALELAFAQHQSFVSDEQVLEWLQTLEGIIFMLWQSMKKQDPEITEDRVRELYLQLNSSQLADIARFLAEGLRPVVAAPDRI